MTGRRALRTTLCVSLFAAALTAPAEAVPPDPVDDGHGRQWRQLYETTGLTWSQVAQVCPRDGATPCAGTVGGKVLTGWVWGTDAQVLALMGAFEPAVLAADPPSVSGPEYFLTAAGFLGEMRWTNSFASTYQFGSWTGGWTSSTDAAGAPVGGGVGYGFPPATGGFGVGTDSGATGPAHARGVWLWRSSDGDHSPPVITPTVSGTAGSSGWYVSDVSVTWDVQDAESPLTSSTGCDPATVTADSTGTTFTCEATSAGGTGSASVVVRRDATRPTVTCTTPAPVFELYRIGAGVPATVTDATSGPVSPVVQAGANTNVPGTFQATLTGVDRAGNRTTQRCAYQVVVPACNGLAPTIVGTALNNTINGTNGRDVIVALAGADTINGRGGDDVICGGDGGDLVDGGDGHEWIDGGASPDDINGGRGDDFLDGGLHNDSLRGGNGRDTCTSGEVRMSSCEG